MRTCWAFHPARTRLWVMAAAALMLSACSVGSFSGSQADQVASWSKGAGVVGSTSQLDADVAHIKTLMHYGGKSAATGCLVLGDDVRKAHGELPTPDSALTTDLDQAYRLLFEAATRCYALAEGNHIGEMGPVISLLDKGTALLARSKVVLASFGVRS